MPQEMNYSLLLDFHTFFLLVETPQCSTSTGGEYSQSTRNVVRRLPPIEHSAQAKGKWAVSWANYRAQQTMLTRTGSERSMSNSRDDRTSVNCESAKTHTRSVRVRSRCIELDSKAAETFTRLRSIYLNDDERNKRLERIRERINEFQTRSIRTEVNKSIQEFNTRMKQDANNRKELRRVREKFSETKKNRLRKMHMSLNALEAPSVSRVAYGLPGEGKEFSANFSSKKTTDDIKKMWRMAIVRKNCIDSFLNKVSERHQDLPDVTVKTTRIRSSSWRRQDSSTVQIPGKEKSKEANLQNDSNHHCDKSLSNLIQLETGILETFESLSSDDEDYEN